MLVWPWLIFLCFILALIVLDLGVLTRRPRQATPSESLLSVLLWVSAAALSSLAIFRLYEARLFGYAGALGISGTIAKAGDAWLQFVTAYVIEIALSIDNIAVLSVIFAHYKLRPAFRARMLLWVVVICLLLRAVLIVIGAELIKVSWMHYVFAGALLLGAVREFLIPRPDADIGDKPLVRLTRRLPTSLADHGQKLVAREPGPDGRRRWVFTPLMMVFIASAAADVSFALDSLPAVFTVTRDPFIAFTANAMAILALRSLYILVAPHISRFRYMKLCLTVILVFLAARMALTVDDRLPTGTSLVFVLSVLVVGVGISVIHERRAPRLPGAAPSPARPTPLEDVVEAAAIARRNVWKIWILIAGTSVILAGIAIAPLPGPGPMVLVPAGLVILATEFVWAQRLLKVFKERSLQLAEQGDRVGELFPKWVLIPIVIAYYGAFAFWLVNSESSGLRLFINCTCLGLSFPFVGWVIRTAKINVGPLNRLVYAKRARPGAAVPGPGEPVAGTDDSARPEHPRKMSSPGSNPRGEG
ncbi:MAG: PGPGW domain-containing protein [Phycisphaerales bacterium]